MSLTNEEVTKRQQESLRAMASNKVMLETIGSLTQDTIMAKTSTLIVQDELKRSLEVIQEQEDLIKKLTISKDAVSAELTKKTTQLTTTVFKNEREQTITRIAGSIFPNFLKSGANCLTEEWLRPWSVDNLKLVNIKQYISEPRYVDAVPHLHKILNVFRISTEGPFKQFLNRDYTSNIFYDREYVLFNVLVAYIRICDVEQSIGK